MLNEAAVRLLPLSETVYEDANITLSPLAGVVPDVQLHVDAEFQFPLALLVQVAAIAWPASSTNNRKMTFKKIFMKPACWLFAA